MSDLELLKVISQIDTTHFIVNHYLDGWKDTKSHCKSYFWV